MTNEQTKAVADALDIYDTELRLHGDRKKAMHCVIAAMTPEAAPKREPGPKCPNYKVLGDRCPECGDNLIHNNKGVECGSLRCTYHMSGSEPYDSSFVPPTSLGVACNATASGSLDPDMPAQTLRLHMGEMTAREERTARAAIRWANSCRQVVVPTEDAGYWGKAFNQLRKEHDALLKRTAAKSADQSVDCREAFDAWLEKVNEGEVWADAWEAWKEAWSWPIDKRQPKRESVDDKWKNRVKGVLLSLKDIHPSLGDGGNSDAVGYQIVMIENMLKEGE